jgi:hypothetical protein
MDSHGLQGTSAWETGRKKQQAEALLLGQGCDRSCEVHVVNPCISRGSFAVQGSASCSVDSAFFSPTPGSVRSDAIGRDGGRAGREIAWAAA